MRFLSVVSIIVATVVIGAPSAKAAGQYTKSVGAINGAYLIPSGSPCADRTSVPDQCSVPVANATAACEADPNCGGYNCNGARTDCQLRYYPLTLVDPTWTGFTSFTKGYEVFAGAITGSWQIPAGSPCDDPNTVKGQCTALTANAAAACDRDTNCAGYTCGNASNNCQLRYYPLTTDFAWASFTSYIKATLGPKATFMGCYADKAAAPAFRYKIQVSPTMTPARCAKVAIAGGFRFFGLENGNECWVTDAGYDTYGTATTCNTPCAGDASQKCGGAGAISTYHAYPQFVPFCNPDQCLANNNDWCKRDQNLQGCLDDRLGSGAGDGTWCRQDGNYVGCLKDHGGIGSRALDGTWCRNDGNTLGCLEEHDHVPARSESRTWTLINDAHSCGTHYTVYRETCKGDHICSGELAPRGQPGDTAKCHLGAAATPFYFCYRFEQQIGGDCTVSDTQTTVKEGYGHAHFSGNNAWAN